MQKNKQKNKPAVRPAKQVCEACENHNVCPAESGNVDYRCPKMK